MFQHQRQEALFQGHADAFDYFGGVPKTIVYDNMKTAVKKVLEGTKREEQDTLSSFDHTIFLMPNFVHPQKEMKKDK
ncbi:hypothetical protein [Heyndrickxia sporothermodurans]|uniref:hypothetical protein n=1 Tax=Heyndrickxia sporothermodurans TaxID=46224 RepID=UPI0036D39965